MEPARAPRRPTIRNSSAGVQGGPSEDDKDMSKQRLQQLIRDFAHDVVFEAGLVVDARYIERRESGKQLLRMDKRLSRLELWPMNDRGQVAEDSHAALIVP